jgi:hypothetical protein
MGYFRLFVVSALRQPPASHRFDRHRFGRRLGDTPGLSNSSALPHLLGQNRLSSIQKVLLLNSFFWFSSFPRCVPPRQSQSISPPKVAGAALRLSCARVSLPPGIVSNERCSPPRRSGLVGKRCFVFWVGFRFFSLSLLLEPHYRYRLGCRVEAAVVLSECVLHQKGHFFARAKGGVFSPVA